MIVLILIVCLAATPDVCREEYPPVEVTSGLSCMVQGQLIAAEWIGDHPKWILRGWRCRFGQPERQT